ncbi:ead/Ea22-like family protein [Escherichia coli]|uniref:ead/Ea22-like family protein n=1 Tax=Escherichia coli TaxID=562 RepID=UPI0011CC837C|nr:ead/Ea22-like family protein [Escherichia coli]TXP94311.1 ead/Ea22-like family protein [Escherichia coli]TXP99793.1 ead/Ea22-like family protein [Escherichia coli]
MSKIDYQVLREAAVAIETVATPQKLLAFRMKVTPQVVLALLDELEAAEKRIAELEARTVKLPEYRNSPDMHTKQFYEAIGFNQGLDVFIEALRAAGIGVKGE